MTLGKALELRHKMKSKKPKFLAQDIHKKQRIRKRWVKPRGRQSKMRLCIKGYRKRVRIGYGSPSTVKGIHKSGLVPVLIYNISDLNHLDSSKEGCIIAKSVGKKNRKIILEKAKESKLNVLNVLDIDKELTSIQEFLDLKKKHKLALKMDKQKKTKEREEAEKKKTSKKDELAEKVLDEEDKKADSKKVMDKVLTKKGAE